MKKLTLILSMMLALVGYHANAAMYIVGNVPFGDWNPGGGVEMTLENGVYTYTATINGTVYFVFADGLNSDWTTFNNDHRYGPTNGNQAVTAGTWVPAQKAGDHGSYFFQGSGEDYVFIFDETNQQFKIEGYVEPVVFTSFTVAGSNADIFGETWNPELTANDMTLDETDGLYKLVKNGISIPAAYSLEYKVVANHSWDNNWGKTPGGDNQDYYFEEGGTYNLTFKFDLENEVVTLDAEKDEAGPVVEDYYIVAGTGNLFGSNWNATDTLNLMTEGEDGIFTWTKEGFEATAGTEVQFKVVANSNWNTCWPVGDENGDNNWLYQFEQDGVYTVVITFNEETKEINLTATRTGDLPEPPEPTVDDVYIFGDVNNYAWDPTQGVLMNYNEGIYTAEVNATMREGQEKAFIGFTKKLAEAESETPWNDIAAYRFGPASDGAFVMTEELLGVACDLATNGSYESIALPEGTWTVTVDLVNNKFTVNGTWPLDTVTPEPTPDVYIFGDVNNYAWDPTQGVLMTLNEGIYTAEVNATMREGQEKAYIGFTKQLADTASTTPWDDIAPYRFGPASDGAFVMTEELLGVECNLATNGSYESIALPEGTWTVTVDLVNNKFTVNGTWPLDTVTPEPTPDVYIFGDVNNYAWDPTQGVLMTLNEGIYTAEVNATMREGQEKAYIGFTKQLADTASTTPWDDIAPYRFGPASDGAFVMTEELLGVECNLATDGSYESIALPEGTWTVTVDLENNKFTVNGTWPVDTVVPEPYTGNVYIIGEVNDNGGWFTNVGVLMNYNEETALYTAEITTAGQNIPENEEIGYSYFSFTKQLAEAADDWDAIAPYRFGAISDGDYWVTDEVLGTEIPLTNNGQAFRVPAGTWNLTLSVDNMTLVIEKVEPSYIRGDVNGDQKVNITDVTDLINFLLTDDPTGINLNAANCNNVDGINIADVTELINFLLTDQWSN